MKKKYIFVLSCLVFLSSCSMYKDYLANDEKVREKLTQEEKLRNEKLRNDEIRAKELKIKEINDCIAKFKKEHKKYDSSVKVACTFNYLNKSDKIDEDNDEY